jgi:antitoxin (DNA-binding transcriptional repressor) of toxin-antitoxin stability system
MPIGIRDLVRLSVYIVSMQVNMHEAKTHFSRLVERALAGEEVVIARDGVPLVTLEPIRRVGATENAGALARQGACRRRLRCAVGRGDVAGV